MEKEDQERIEMSRISQIISGQRLILLDSVEIESMKTYKISSYWVDTKKRQRPVANHMDLGIKAGSGINASLKLKKTIRN